MKEGEKWELYIPSNLAYGNEGYGEIIPPDCPLQFTIELIKVEGEYKNLSSK
jgi:FKBP-type peptidyl-prolyl cis-trans isomerase FklB